MVDKHIRIGDAVMLKAGGPVMTVQALSMSLAYCAWRAGDRTHHGTFEVESLALAERPGRQASAHDGDDSAADPAR